MPKQKPFRKPRHRYMKAAHPIRWRLRRWFVPNKQNNFRPVSIGRYSIGFIAVAFIAAQVFAFSSSSGPSVLGSQAPINAVQLLEATNSEREKSDAAPLSLNSDLSRAASLKAQDMLDNNYWSHTSPSGITPWQWFEKVDYSYAYAGENLARNFSTAPATVSAWMSSPGHRDNMLHAYYTEVGFAITDGVMDGKPVRLVVALYATPASALPGVAGIHTYAPKASPLSTFARIGIAVQGLSAPTVGILAVISVIIVVASVTSVAIISNCSDVRGGLWRRHHASVKAIGMILFVVGVVALGSSGQIG